LFVTPDNLGGEGFLEVFEFDSVVFQGFGELLKEGFGVFDQSVQSSSLVLEGSLLVFEVVQEDFPISLRSLFSLLGSFLFFNDSLSDVVKQFQNLHNIFVIQFGS